MPFRLSTLSHDTRFASLELYWFICPLNCRTLYIALLWSEGGRLILLQFHAENFGDGIHIFIPAPGETEDDSLVSIECRCEFADVSHRMSGF